METALNYEEAYKELQTIVSELEHSEIGIDELNQRMKRAAELLRLCKDKLFKTEESVQEVLEEIRKYSRD